MACETFNRPRSASVELTIDMFANTAGVLLPRLWPLIHRRGYGVKPKYYREVAQTYAQYRRDLSQHRKQFREEWLERQRMTQTEYNVKAAEEARQKEMEEARALDEARREFERMARKRLVQSI